MLPDEIPLPQDDIPLPPDEIPLPPEEIPLPPDDIPIPPDDIPIPSPPPPDDSHQNQRPAQAQQLKRPLSPSTSPPEPRSRKKPKPDQRKGGKKGGKRSPSHRKDADTEVSIISDEQAAMVKLMGFSSFNSTKGKMVPGNQSVGAVHVVKRQRCRQYMNRKGGFNRPLDKTS